MVKLHVKKGDESQFLYETTVETPVESLISELVVVYNGRLKVQRLCTEMEMLADHGITLPPNMQGLTDEQIEELKLKDEWKEKCQPSGGSVQKPDEIGRRNGDAPNEKMSEMMKKTIHEAKDIISKKKVDANVTMTQACIQQALDILRGAVMIVYPMGLPPHDPVKQEIDNNEDLSGTQASLEVLEEANTAVWWAGKEMTRGKKLADFVGKNEKTKIMCKLQKKGQGPPGREPVVSQEDQKAMMAYAYRRQEEMKKLEKAQEDEYLNSGWADSNSLKRQFQGLNNIQWGPGKS